MSKEEMRKVAREEIASMAGMILAELQGKSAEVKADDPAEWHMYKRSIEVTEFCFGHVLRDFGATESAPGEEVSGAD